MLVSIIIPVYNVNKYIEECIESVINVHDTEVIIVDDGSIENTDFLIEKYQKYCNFRFFRKQNGGLSSARNFGVKECQGEYVIFLDGDDYLDTEEFLLFLKKVKETRQEAYLYSFSMKDGFETIPEKHDWKEKVGVIKIEEAIKLFIRKPILMVAWRYCIRRDLFIKYNLKFFEGIYHEDEDWTPRLLLSLQELYFYPAVIYCYRTMRMGSIMYHINEKHIVDLFKITD